VASRNIIREGEGGIMEEAPELYKVFESYPNLLNPLKRDRVEVYADRIVYRQTDSSEIVKGAAKMATGIGMFHGAKQIAKAAWKQGGLVAKEETIVMFALITGVNVRIDNPIYRTIELSSAEQQTHFRVKKEDADEISQLISKKANIVRKTIRVEGNDSEAVGGAVAPPSSSAELDQLKALSELHKAGVLTDEEFSAKKSEILGRI